MTTSTLSTAEKALKEFFIEPARVMLNEGTGPFLAKIEKTTENVEGFKIKMPIKYGRSGGIGNRTESGDLPEAKARSWKQAEWDTKNIFARMMLTDKLIKASKSNKGAFVSQLESQMEDLMTDTKDSFRRQLFGKSTGVMAVTAAHTSVNTITVSSARFFYEGQRVDILTSAGADKSINNRVITSVDRANKTITIDGAVVTTLATDIVVLNGDYGLELTGLGDIYTLDSTLYGLDRSTYKWFNPTKIAVGGEITELKMQEAIDEADARMGAKIDFIMCNYGVARGFQNNQLSYKKNINYETIKGGYDVMMFGKIPISRELYEDDGTMRFLDSSNFKIYQIEDWDWMDRDGAVLSRVANKAAYEASLVKYCDLGCDKPGAQSALTGITEH